MRLGAPRGPTDHKCRRSDILTLFGPVQQVFTEPSPCAHVHLHLWGHRDPVLETLPTSRSGLTSGEPVGSCRLNGVCTAPFRTAGFAPASPSRAPVRVCSSLACLGAHGHSLAGSGGSQSPVVTLCLRLSYGGRMSNARDGLHTEAPALPGSWWTAAPVERDSTPGRGGM